MHKGDGGWSHGKHRSGLFHCGRSNPVVMRLAARMLDAGRLDAKRKRDRRTEMYETVAEAFAAERKKRRRPLTLAITVEM